MPKLRRRILVPVLVLLLAVGVAGGLVWHHRMSPYHFRVVTPGVLYRSGFLRPGNLRKVVKEYGIHTVLNLCTDREKERPDYWTFPQEVKICSELGVHLIQMPIDDDTPPSDAQIREWLDLLANHSARPILVHCDHGVIRTGMLVAIYQMEYLGRSNRDALDGMPMFGHDPNLPKREPMRKFLLNYRCRTRGEAPSSH